ADRPDRSSSRMVANAASSSGPPGAAAADRRTVTRQSVRRSAKAATAPISVAVPRQKDRASVPATHSLRWNSARVVGTGEKELPSCQSLATASRLIGRRNPPVPSGGAARRDGG